MIKQIFLLCLSLVLSGCSTASLVELARESKCKTEVARQSKFICEFDGEKVFAKKN